MKYTAAGEPVWVALAIPETAIVTYRCPRMQRHSIRANMHIIFRHVGIEGCRAYAEFVNALYRKAN